MQFPFVVYKLLWFCVYEVNLSVISSFPDNHAVAISVKSYFRFSKVIYSPSFLKFI